MSEQSEPHKAAQAEEDRVCATTIAKIANIIRLEEVAGSGTCLLLNWSMQDPGQNVGPSATSVALRIERLKQYSATLRIETLKKCLRPDARKELCVILSRLMRELKSEPKKQEKANE